MSTDELKRRREESLLIFMGLSRLLLDRNASAMLSVAPEEREVAALAAYIYFGAIASQLTRGIPEDPAGEKTWLVAIMRDKALKELEAVTFRQYRTHASDNPEKIRLHDAEHPQLEKTFKDPRLGGLFEELFSLAETRATAIALSLQTGDALDCLTACDGHLREMIFYSLRWMNINWK